LLKAGRLACIAHQIGDTGARDQLVGNLRTVLTAYLIGGQPSTLRYDSAWGMVTSGAGLTNPDADFGSGRANDHYFHFGYTIAAAAVVARFDPTWAGTVVAGRTHGDRVNDLVRDIANPSPDDPYFVPWRHFDHFAGHSWAGGLFEFDADRNQESTSEAANAWWGIQQWGVATSQSQVAMLGTALLTEEIATARKYWQIRQAETTWPAGFRANGVVGILWSGKADFGTWFSGLPECIFGIQMLPHNPMLEALLDPAWLAEIWTPKLLPIFTRTSPAPEHGWLGILVAARAHTDPNDAWTRAQTLTGYDDGTSKTQLLYHIATRT
jgi:endo-1,3(4)-beta-glucanase